MELNSKKISLPVISTKGFVLFPAVTASLDIISDESIAAVKESMTSYNELIIVTSQIDTKNETFDKENIHSVGVLCRIKSSRKNSDGSYKINIIGVDKIKIIDVKQEEIMNFAECEIIDDIQGEFEKEAALVRTIAKTLNGSNMAFSSMPPSVSSTLSKGVSSHVLANTLCYYLDVDVNKKQSLLEINEINQKLETIVERLNQEYMINKIEEEINLKMKKRIEDNQRDYILREKMRIIKEELGDISSKETDADDIRKIINENPYPKRIKGKVLDELKKYEMTPSASPDSAIIRNYIDLLISLPWYQKDEEKINIKEVEKTLNDEHFGLDKPKERILEYLAVRNFTDSTKAPILCFVGPPGVGKTSLALSIAKALKRHFVKISLGGVHDESEIRGHRRTYIGAMPGKIIQGMKKAKVINPIFVLDEIDKLSSDFKGDPSSALLEVLDPEQNYMFNDHYLEESYDLSGVLFIATANHIGNVPAALKDRLEIINLSSYTEIEKLHIAKNHLINKQLVAHSLTDQKIVFSDDAIMLIIRYYTKESGVRQLERYIAEILRKIITKHVKDDNDDNDDKFDALIDINKVKEYLGKEKFDYAKREKNDEIGLVNGLAYTDFGGDLIPIEVNYFAGKGKLVITGNLGDIMKESANIGLDYIKANSQILGIDEKIFEKIDIHIHVPEGAVPKDGPSAGVTMTTALVSALTNKPVRNDVAMTGEITLRGNVLPIGGLKEKSISAHRAGIKIMIIPKDNEKDLDEIPTLIKDNMEIIFANKIEDYLNVALVKVVNSVSI